MCGRRTPGPGDSCLAGLAGTGGREIEGKGLGGAPPAPLPLGDGDGDGVGVGVWAWPVYSASAAHRSPVRIRSTSEKGAVQLPRVYPAKDRLQGAPCPSPSLHVLALVHFPSLGSLKVRRPTSELRPDHGFPASPSRPSDPEIPPHFAATHPEHSNCTAASWTIFDPYSRTTRRKRHNPRYVADGPVPIRSCDIPQLTLAPLCF